MLIIGGGRSFKVEWQEWGSGDRAPSAIPGKAPCAVWRASPQKLTNMALWNGRKNWRHRSGTASNSACPLGIKVGRPTARPAQ